VTCLSQSRKPRAISDLRFVYDGWNLIGTLNSQLSTRDTFVRDFGLSTLNLQLSTPFQPSPHFVSYDGNGNVTALVNAADGSESARYEYGPFGEVIRANGAASGSNPFRFSTKYQDDETDLLYYGYRYYSASTGRWISQDPLADFAFYARYLSSVQNRGQREWYRQQSLSNPFMSVLNDAVCRIDGDGAVPVLIIFGTGRLISSVIVACIDCRTCEKCVINTYRMIKQAADKIDWDQLIEWALAEPGRECMEPCSWCAVEASEIVFWGGLGRDLKLKYAAGGHY
jgi:RHS repeat-associated protein